MNNREAPLWSARLRSASTDLGFIMQVNGYNLCPDGTLQLDYNTDTLLLQKYSKSLLTIFRTPYFTYPADLLQVAGVLNQKAVLDVVHRYRQIDEGEAGRICFLLGGLARTLKYKNVNNKEIAAALAFTADMVRLGERRSGEEITAALVMYVLNGGSVEENPTFKSNVSRMAEAITEDQIFAQEIADLGMSQAARLLGFVRKMQNGQGEDFNSTLPTYQEVLTADLPTIGAEFHIPAIKEVNDTFWQRVAMLNMAQYQSGSYIPLLKTEEGLIEIRMNPSIYPVAVATWNLMRLLLPELNRSYFTITISCREVDYNAKADNSLIKLLHALGNLCYTSSFKEVPRVTTLHQVKFGDRYLGQTVRIVDGRFILTGRGGVDSFGQLNICSGYGDLFPNLAFYLSMALTEPAMLERHILGHDIGRAQSLGIAIKFKEKDIWNIFEALNRSIVANPRLYDVVEHGQRIMEELRP